MRRLDVGRVSRIGLLLFFAGSTGSAASWSLPALIAFRCLQGVGAAMLLAGAVALLSALTGSTARGVALWTAAGTFGAALGPALGGVLTELFNWRAIFVFQAPVALIALVAAFESHLHPRGEGDRRGSNSANLALGFLFGALVGALFLGVLLVITVWGLSPITGALVVSALPAGALAARLLERELSPQAERGRGRALPRRRAPRPRTAPVDEQRDRRRGARVLRLRARPRRAGALACRRPARDAASSATARSRSAHGTPASSSHSRSSPRSSPTTSSAAATTRCSSARA